MRRRASIVCWSLLVSLLVATAGCSGLSARLGRLRDLPTQEQSSQAQQYSERAQAAIDRGDLEQARTEMLQLVAHSPGSAEAHHRLGRILQLQERLNEAEACYHRALELDADYVGALIGLGTIEAAKGEPQSALKHFETAIEIDPQDAEAHFARAGVLEGMGRTDEALAAYFRTLEFNPLRPEVSRRIGAIQLARNQPDQALVRLDQAVDQSPNDGEVRLLRGRAHLMLRHASQAIVDFRAAALMLPARADVQYQLALAFEAAHLPGEALKAAETALRLSPNYADARDLSKRLRR
jgi:tetratricopeptide (TPR) repeat protein